MIRHLLAAATFALVVQPIQAQAPRTISHQGFLTDSADLPVKDSTWSMDFGLYDGTSAAAALLWSQNAMVPTSSGVFSVVLGPISGVDFGQPLWLATTVAGEELSPRTPLASVPSSFALVLPYVATGDTSAPIISIENAGSGIGLRSADRVDIETNDLGPMTGVTSDEDLLVESGDAVIGLYSNSSGATGSAIVLGEVDGFGILEDKWAILRGTTGATAELDFRFGTAADHEANPRKVAFDTLGRVHSNAYRYHEAKTFYHSIPPHAFSPTVVSTATTWRVSGYGGYYTAHEEFAGVAAAEVHLPNGAVVTQFGCRIYDLSATYDLDCTLERIESGGITDMATVSSTGSAGADFYPTTTISNPIINDIIYSYSVVVRSGFDWDTAGSDLEIQSVFIHYTLIEIP